MLDIGWTELLLIGIVALIVVGPKDLPGMFRTLGRFTGKMKGMAREFQRAMNDAADESGVKDIAGDLKNVTSKKSLGLDTLDRAASSFEKWEPGKSSDGKGAETTRLSEERAAAAKKINESAARMATERHASEAKAATETDTAPATESETVTEAKTPAPTTPAPKPTPKAAAKPKAAKAKAVKPATPAKKPVKAATKPRAKAKPKPAPKSTGGDA